MVWQYQQNELSDIVYIFPCNSTDIFKIEVKLFVSFL